MQTLFTQEQIQIKVQELAKQIAADSKNIFCLVVLKGAIVFFSDLIRELSKLDVQVEFDIIQLSSYIKKEFSGEVKIKKDIENIENKDVLIVEDIVDTGHSLTFLKDYLLNKKAKSVRICSLLSKPDRREKQVEVDYLGFIIPNKFVVGYGIDYQEKHRELPFIATID
ncbi:hypoxanthine phosphoribosyltransferase [Nanoarchaeota archaeon]